MTRAAAGTGVSRPMISQLERGQRRPSVSLAEALIAGYGMSAAADAMRSLALDWVGRDSPYRTGVSPPWGTPYEHHDRTNIGPSEVCRPGKRPRGPDHGGAPKVSQRAPGRRPFTERMEC